MLVTDPSHFVPVHELARFHPTTSFRDVYKTLSNMGRGGFILDRGASQEYIKAHPLAKAVIASGVLAAVSQMPIGQVVDAYGNGSIIANVSPTMVDENADGIPLQNLPDTAFQIASNNATMGWFLNHEKLAVTNTQKTVFLCANNPAHENPDPDTGSCAFCPEDLVGTKAP